MSKALTQEEVKIRLLENFEQEVELVSEYKTRRNKITIRCKRCGYIWSVVAGNVIHVDLNKGKHQCPECGNVNKNKKNGKLIKCSLCGKEVYRTKYQIEKNLSGKFYCSRNCGNRSKNEIRENSGEWISTSNYRRTAFKNYEHKCATCSYNEDIRILEVHHIDEDRSNNNLSNLVILCPNCHRKITLKYYTLKEDNGKYFLEQYIR